MQRPDLDPLACVNPACQLFRPTGAHHLVIRKVYGHDPIRLWRCRTCGEECSARRGTARCHTKLPAATAADGMHQRDEGWRVRGTARLVKVAQETVARLVRVAGRHAERCHAQHVRGRTPKALACDAPGRCVKKSRRAAMPTRRRWRARGGTTPQ
jgi:transposase-like protein